MRGTENHYCWQVLELNMFCFPVFTEIMILNQEKVKFQYQPKKQKTCP